MKQYSKDKAVRIYLALCKAVNRGSATFSEEFDENFNTIEVFYTSHHRVAFDIDYMSEKVVMAYIIY